MAMDEDTFTLIECSTFLFKPLELRNFIESKKQLETKHTLTRTTLWENESRKLYTKRNLKIIPQKKAGGESHS